MTTDWADEKAREWLGPFTCSMRHVHDGTCECNTASLAALLREVRSPDLSQLHDEAVRLGYDAALAEVRKIVEEVRANHPPARECFDAWMSCDEILRRIEGLDG